MLSKEIKLTNNISIVSYPGWKFEFSKELNDKNNDCTVIKKKDKLIYLNNLELEKKVDKKFKIYVNKLIPLIKPKMILKNRVDCYIEMINDNKWNWDKTIISLVRENNKFRLLDGAHRVLAARKTGIRFLSYIDYTDIILNELKNY